MSILLALRTHYVFKQKNSPAKFREIFWSHSFGMLIANVSPLGRGGYLMSIPLYSRYTNQSKTEVMGTLISIQSIEMIVKGFIAVFALTLIGLIVGEPVYLIPLLVGSITVLSLGTIGLLALKYKPYWVEDVPVLGDLAGYLQSFPNFKKLSIFITVTSLVCWFLRGIEWYFIGLAVNTYLPLHVYLLMHPLLTAVKFIPLTPGSFGLFEITVIWGLHSLGVTPETSFTFALLDRFDNILDIISLKEVCKKK